MDGAGADGDAVELEVGSLKIRCARECRTGCVAAVVERGYGGDVGCGGLQENGIIGVAGVHIRAGVDDDVAAAIPDEGRGEGVCVPADERCVVDVVDGVGEGRAAIAFFFAAEHLHKFIRPDGDARERPHEGLGCFITQKETREIHRRCTCVMQFDPILAVAILIDTGLIAFVGAFVDDDLGVKSGEG